MYQRTRRVIAEEKKHPIPPSMKRKSDMQSEEARPCRAREGVYLTKICMRGVSETMKARYCGCTYGRWLMNCPPGTTASTPIASSGRQNNVRKMNLAICTSLSALERMIGGMVSHLSDRKCEAGRQWRLRLLRI